MNLPCSTYLRSRLSTPFLRFAAGLLAIGLFMGVAPAFAGQQTIQQGDIQVSIIDDESGVAVTVSWKQGVGSATAMLVENPPRLAIDIKGIKLANAKKHTVSTSAVTGVRFGLYPDKTRVVIDLKDPVAQDFNVAPGSKSATVTLSRLGGKATAAPITAPSDSPTSAPKATATPKPSPEAKPTPEPTPTKSPSPTPSVKPTAAPKTTAEPTPTVAPKSTPSKSLAPTPSLTPTPAPTSTPTRTPSPAPSSTATSTSAPTPAKDSATGTALPVLTGPTVVRAIKYQLPAGAGGESTIIIEMDAPGNFTLNPKGGSAFDLEIERASLAGAFLTLPQFPPDTFRGIEVVTAKTSGQNVILSIFAEDNVKLSPYRAKGSLIIRVEQ
ncbi:MAG: AMIN domain-containing protein [Deltaproteobacteria bacterium]|nr:AMIN domain-containing protein [Deltaproteobacteria bacterium]